MDFSLKKRITSCSLSLALLLTLTTVARADTQTKGEKADKDLPLIVGGEEAQPGAWPWMAALGQIFPEAPPDFFAQFCGGSLIAPDLVLTAAHCVVNGVTKKPSEIEVLLGGHSLSSSEGERISVAAVMPFPDYPAVSQDFDLALLRLATPSAQTPVQLIRPEDEATLAAPGVLATVTGWGSRDPTGGNPPDALHQVSLPIVSNEICGESELFICAGDAERTACSGDSGGPLMVPNAQGDGFVQVGVVSHGGVPCGNGAGAFTRVSKFSDFIEDPFSDQIYFAQFGNGAGLQSDVVLVNVSSTLPAVGNIIFRDFTGNQLSEDIVSASAAAAQISGSRFTLPPGGMITLSSSGVGNLTIGSATVTSESRISAVIRFRISGIGITGVGSSARHRAVIAPARRQGDLSTGVAIRNTEDEAITVQLTLKDPSGQVVENGTATLTIPGQGQVAKFIHELFNADTTDFEGTISAEAESGRIAVVALELGAQPGEFTTLPVSPID